MTVVIPTLTADFALGECLRALAQQTFPSFEVIVVDNSAKRLVRKQGVSEDVQVIENQHNVGFGTAINQGIAMSRAHWVATLNDDAIASPQWLAELVAAGERDATVGMCASEVVLFGRGELDSAGMLIARDGSSKQRGHGRPAAEYGACEVLAPSGSAALYRREMLDQIGGFDDDFFLYCEDTDLGLRARWAGWKAVYAAGAVVEHRYSHSAGRASALKAYYVERNRLFVVVKNFPALSLLAAPLFSVVRYVWHVVAMLRGHGAAGEFARNSSGLALPWFVLRAHVDTLLRLPSLWRKRRAIRSKAKLSSREFTHLLKQHHISVREVAAL